MPAYAIYAAVIGAGSALSYARHGRIDAVRAPPGAEALMHFHAIKTSLDRQMAAERMEKLSKS